MTELVRKPASATNGGELDSSTTQVIPGDKEYTGTIKLTGGFDTSGNAGIATSTEYGLVKTPSEITVAMDGGFNSGSFTAKKIDDWVTIYFPVCGVSPAGASPGTSSGLLPVEYRPTASLESNVYSISGTQVLSVEIDNAGLIRFRFRDWAGAGSNRVDTLTGASITYKI